MKFSVIPFVLLWFSLPLLAQKTSGTHFKCQDGALSFSSSAPLEKIDAQSKALQGIIDPENMTFAWSVQIKSFEGFNSPLQREHFQENYMESDKFPTAVFKGKIIEEVDWQTPQSLTIRAKGKLIVHGVEKERIIKVQVDIDAKSIVAKSTFTVALADHAINIPKIVNQKIAEEVEVKVAAKLIKS